MAVPTIIRCAVPDCDWGFEITDSGRMDHCYRAYAQHCHEMHGVEPEAYITFDLEKLTLSLKK